jgi:hypothetical protein
MSLAERLSSMEDYESIREPSPSSEQGKRKLSFNPIGSTEVHEEPVGAFEVSKTKRICENHLDFCNVH